MSTPAFRLSVVSLLPLATVAGLSVAEGRAPSVEAVRFNIVTEHAATPPSRGPGRAGLTFHLFLQ